MSSADRVRVRGLTIHRPIIYGNTAVLLSPEERQNAPPEHTHRWTVAVRSAASKEDGDMIGGADNISHFLKRVTFKLHETYPNPIRNVDKPPFEVTETGWGEFEVQIKLTVVPEAVEKPITLYHQMKLHPWTLSGGDGTDLPAPESALTAPVHAWQYDELVFSDPYQSFLNILLQHPPTPLPKIKRRPIPFTNLNPRSLIETGTGTPEFTQLMVSEEAERLEKARQSLVAETEKWRNILIQKEKTLAQLKKEAGG